MKSVLISAGLVRFGVVVGLSLSLNVSAAVADVVVVVSVKNPVTTLSKYEIVDIFLGKANHFPDGSQVVAIDQDEGSAARNEFYASFAGKSAAQLKAYWSKIIFTGRGRPPEHVSNDSAVRKFLGNNPNAIGYIERKLADDSVKVLVVQ